MKSIAEQLTRKHGADRLKPPVPITMVITDLDVGGAERAFSALAIGLDRRRWTPSVVCLDGEGELVAPLRSAGIETTCLKVDRRRPGSAILRLAAEFRRNRPALVQSFLFHANVASRLAGWIAGRPIVVGGLRVAERRANSHLYLDRITQGLAAGSVCVSQGVADFSVEVGRLDPKRLVVIPNGVDPRRFYSVTPIPRSELRLEEDRPIGVFIGRLDLQKGVDHLIEAAALVPGWDLLIVGDGPELERLRSKVDALSDLKGRVKWLGRRSDVPRLLGTADFLVLPSLWEGMPNVVLEAMAAGIAVVGTSVEGTRELVVPEVTGLLVPPANAERLADAIRRIINDTDRRRSMGAAGRRRIEADYTPARVVDAYEKLWSGLLGIASNSDQDC